jgi:DUF4097 and DUF4098 domain-containing protein YvlB
MSESQVKNNAPLIIALIVIAVLILCCCLVVAGLVVGGVLSVPWKAVTDSRIEATEELEQRFDVSTPVLLEMDINVGDIVIRTGDGDEVRIYAVKHAWGRDRGQAQDHLDDFEVRMSQPNSGEVTVETETPQRLRDLPRTPTVDLEITMPRQAKLDIVVNVGKLEVTGVRGKFVIQSNVGDITLRDVRFEQDSEIKSNVGNIELRLPEDSAFAFSARSNVGDVRVDFDVRNQRSEEKIVGDSIEGEIGTSPTVDVELRTSTGDIKIQKE